MAPMDSYDEAKAPCNEEIVTKINDLDTRTPDDWVPRHDELVRLTGRHPFNVEPHLPRLLQKGWTTPSSLHYVRNHGAVPIKWHGDEERRAVWSNWRIEIGGLVDTQLSVTLDELASMQQVTLPVLLVCAGNRRKEQNMVKKTIGFNWGPAGLGNSYWTGVRLVDVLAKAGLKPDAAHIEFSGPKGELPAGRDGSYATSVERGYAMNPANDIIIAYQQNGRLLDPDHGYPVRLIIPGFIGGRMIKWLGTINALANESDNHYHFKDNRVLPVGVDPERAETEGWWFKPEYIINQLNINSAIGSPAHGEELVLGGSSGAAPAEVEVSGYAYCGNGSKIIRCEVSLDGGETWALTNELLYHPDEPTQFGKYWCWVFWKTSVALTALAQADEILCRAWNAEMNTQPGNLTWNVMGMLNNPWYRVRRHVVNGPPDPATGTPRLALRFEHPTQPGAIEGGWMNTPVAHDAPASTGQAKMRVMLAIAAANGSTAPSHVPVPGVLRPSAGAEPPLPAAPPTLPQAIPAAGAGAPKVVNGKLQITLAELEKHVTETDCWIAIKGVVYDVPASYLAQHPGGGESIMMVAGTDATDEFVAIHSQNGHKTLKPFAIGELVAERADSPISSVDTPPHPPPLPLADVPHALNPKKRVPVKLVEREMLSSDTVRLRFALPRASEGQLLGLPDGKHFFVYTKDKKKEGELVIRAYTPTTGNDLVGHVELVVKIYSPLPPRFPDGGRQSQILGSLSIGDGIELKGPFGEIEYIGAGIFRLPAVDDASAAVKFDAKVTSMALIAGGTGLTPMLQLIHAVLREPKDASVPQIDLLYANQTPADILLREHLDELAATHSDRLRVWFTVDRPTEGWQFSAGFIDEAMLRAHVAPGDVAGAFAFMCGPPPMLKFAVRPNLLKLGYTEDNMFSF